MPKPASRNIVVYRGDSYTHAVVLTTDGTTAVNITGRTYAAQVRTTTESSDVVATFTTANGGSNGTVTLTLAAATTAALTPGSYVWDLQETNGANPTTLLAGACSVQGDVTR